MQSIITRYYGATTTKPACIRAWTSGNPKKRYTFSKEKYETSRNAAYALAERLEWPGVWAGGSLGNDMDVYVNYQGRGMNEAETFTVYSTER
jgi:hypothetical protein